MAQSCQHPALHDPWTSTSTLALPRGLRTRAGSHQRLKRDDQREEQSGTGPGHARRDWDECLGTDGQQHRAEQEQCPAPSVSRYGSSVQRTA